MIPRHIEGEGELPRAESGGAALPFLGEQVVYLSVYGEPWPAIVLAVAGRLLTIDVLCPGEPLRLSQVPYGMACAAVVSRETLTKENR